MSTLPAQTNPVYINLTAYQGTNPNSQQNGVFYNNPNLTSAIIVSDPIIIPANTLISAPVVVPIASGAFVNCLSPVFFAVYDATLPQQTFGVGTASGSGIVLVGAGGFLAFPCGGALPANLYFSNPNAQESLVNIVCLSN